MSEVDAGATGQVKRSAAEVYEEFFVPALFDQWPDRLLDAAGLAAGDHVLDVGCGTGILARTATRRLQGSGAIAGVDVNAGMLAVARRAAADVTWYEAAAECLPFPDGSFDRVVSQFALMFFADRAAALAEMGRVARPGATIAIATWADVEHSPGYAGMIDLLRRLFGDQAADALSAPFAFGTAEAMNDVAGEAFGDATVTVHHGEARFASLEAWMHTDIRGWTLADMIDDDQYAELLAAASVELARFAGPDGRVTFAAPALITVARPATARN